MVNSILSWCKGNYEKLILGILSILLVMIGLRLFSGVDTKKELEGFRKEVQPPKTKVVNSDPMYIPDLDAYVEEKPVSYYQPLSDRAVFFPTEVKRPIGPTIPLMNLECTGVISTAGNVLVATLKNFKTGNTYSVKEGEQAENFIVVSITRDVVILSGEGGQHRLNPPAVQMSFKLTGIMPIDTGLEAMLQDSSTKQTHFVKVGDKIGNWDVLNISENAVIIFRQDVGKYELKIGGEFQRIQE